MSNQDEITSLRSQLAESQARESTLRTALEFYANGKNFQTIFDDPVGTRAEIYERYQQYSIGDLGVTAHEALRLPAPDLVGVIKELSAALERIVMMNECDPPRYSLSHLSIHANDALESTREIRERIGAT